jgi:hypothetical protein
MSSGGKRCGLSEILPRFDNKSLVGLKSGKSKVKYTGGFSTQEGLDMRKLACLLLLAAGMLGVGGCATPAYTGGENASRILRTWDLEAKQAVDDLDFEMMFTPTSPMTKWNLR